jgi:hypothetical protein
MPVRYAVASGNWSNPSIWDNGAVPADGDDVYANGFNVTINQNINPFRISNHLSPARVPNLATPAMTSNTTPSGVAFASSVAGGSSAFNAFDQSTGTAWSAQTGNIGIIGYQFTSAKIIKQYAFFTPTLPQNCPTAWTFQGSNDGTAYDTIETVTGFSSVVNTWFVRNISSNITPYTYYRMNITAVGITGFQPAIVELQMTESTGNVYGTIASGSFISTNNIQISGSIQYGTGGVGNNTSCFIITGSHFVGITGSIVGVPNLAFVANKHGLIITNGGTGSIVGNVGGGQIQNTATSNNNYGIFVITGSVNVTGGLAGGASNESVALTILNGTASISGTLVPSTVASPIIIGGGSAQVNFTGTPILSNSSTAIYTNVTAIKVVGNNNGVINYNGPVIASNVPCIRLSAGTMTVNITGSVSSIGFSNAVDSAIISSVASVINISGSITGAPNVPAIQSTSTSGLVRVTGPLISQNNYPAVYSPRIQLINNSPATYTLQTETFNQNITLGELASLNYPTASNVRSGSVYGNTNQFTGTMIIPPANTVYYGVPVDTTTGSATTITPQEIFDCAISLLTGSNTIGARLQNISTTQTTAAVIAAFKGKK